MNLLPRGLFPLALFMAIARNVDEKSDNAILVGITQQFLPRCNSQDKRLFEWRGEYLIGLSSE